jgi:hypothetical protein
MSPSLSQLSGTLGNVIEALKVFHLTLLLPIKIFVLLALQGQEIFLAVLGIELRASNLDIF